MTLVNRKPVGQDEGDEETDERSGEVPQPDHFRAQERTALTDTTHAWLLSLGWRLDEIEEDTPEGFEKRKQLIGLLVKSISLGKSQQEGRAEVQITYRFGPPPASDAESGGSFMPDLKNGRRS